MVDLEERKRWAEHHNYCHISKQTFAYRPYDLEKKNPMPVCEKCRDHVQNDELGDYDCKVLFYEFTPDGKIKELGQCCCYNQEHHG
jgi:hypothetical protein